MAEEDIVKPKVYVHQLDHLAQIIEQLEADLLKFTVLGYFDELHMGMKGGWTALDRMKEHEEFRTMADELNAVIAPIKAKYARHFRAKLAKMAADFAAYEEPGK